MCVSKRNIDKQTPHTPQINRYSFKLQYSQELLMDGMEINCVPALPNVELHS